LQRIPITWPFAVWNLDMVGPLRQAPRGFTHLLVAVDEFSKWIEARPIVNVRSEEAVSFLTEEGNQVALEDAIDQLDEARDVALLWSAKYQQALRRYHKRNMRPREFHVGDLMLR
jgi:hypothetical protein